MTSRADLSARVGVPPLLAYADHSDGGTGEPLAALLRPGNAGSNNASDHITVFDTAQAQLPQPWRTSTAHQRIPTRRLTDPQTRTSATVTDFLNPTRNQMARRVAPLAGVPVSFPLDIHAAAPARVAAAWALSWLAVTPPALPRARRRAVCAASRRWPHRSTPLRLMITSGRWVRTIPSDAGRPGWRSDHPQIISAGQLSGEGIGQHGVTVDKDNAQERHGINCARRCFVA